MINYTNDGLDKRFNSLQTGKSIQRRREKKNKTPFLVFQFPSNGKADTKSDGQCRVDMLMTARFNSLQTGKQIQRGQ